MILLFIAEVMKAAGRFGASVTRGAARAGAYAIENPARAVGKVALAGGKQVGKAALSGTALAARGAYSMSGIGVRAGIKYGPGAYRKTNAFSKMALGSSIPEIAAVGGAGLATYAALSDDPMGGIQQAGRLLGATGDQMQAARRPTYSTTVFQQSTQGLTFGLNSRRTAY